MKTMICMILDRSGSMKGREADVIGGVNTFIEEQKKLPDPASIAFVRFDTEATERFRPMGPLAECEPLGKDEYQPRGGTPLLDAIGATIAHLDEDWKTEKPERCIAVIVTDGEENSSHEYTKAKIKEMIESRQASGMWAFIYLGANVDAFAEASAMGVQLQNVAGYVNSQEGVKHMYAAASAGVYAMRSTGQTVAPNLGGDIQEDGSLKQPWSQAQQQAAQAGSKPWVPPTGTAAPKVTRAWQPPVSGVNQ